MCVLFWACVSVCMHACVCVCVCVCMRACVCALLTCLIKMHFFILVLKKDTETRMTASVLKQDPNT